MELRTEHAQGVALLAVNGRLDSVTAPELQYGIEACVAAGTKRVAVDCSGLAYISSAGFRVLLIGARRCSAAGGRMVLFGLASEVRRLFEIAAFTELFAIHTGRAEAVAALESASGGDGGR